MPPRPLGPEAAAVRALMAAGVPARLVERVLPTIDVVEDDDADAIEAKVAAAKAEVPAFFPGAVTPAPFGNKRPVPAGGPTSMADAENDVRERYLHLLGPTTDSAA